LREGRAALHTSIASYKFLITYGLLFSVLKLACYYYGVIMCQVRSISNKRECERKGESLKTVGASELRALSGQKLRLAFSPRKRHFLL